MELMSRARSHALQHDFLKLVEQTQQEKEQLVIQVKHKDIFLIPGSRDNIIIAYDKI